MSEHEANNAILWISDKLWQSLSADQKQWVLTAGRDVSTQEPKKAFELERQAGGKLKGMGVKIVTDVDKSGFQQIANPYLDKLAKDLGPHADKIKNVDPVHQLIAQSGASAPNPKFASSVPQCVANFGIGTLADHGYCGHWRAG